MNRWLDWWSQWYDKPESKSYMKNWVPTIPTFVNIDLDGVLTDQIRAGIKWVEAYKDRAQWVFALTNSIWAEVYTMPGQWRLNHLSDLKGEPVALDQFVRYDDPERVRKIINILEWVPEAYFMNYVLTNSNYQLYQLLKGELSGRTNLIYDAPLQENIDASVMANNKVFLRSKHSDLMVNWEVLNVFEDDYKEQILLFISFPLAHQSCRD